jgi:hypothetical protein
MSQNISYDRYKQLQDIENGYYKNNTINNSNNFNFKPY